MYIKTLKLQIALVYLNNLGTFAPILKIHMNKFEQLGLSESLLKAILDLGFENPTEVQEKAIPLLEKDTDMVALAQTGTGKRQHLVFQLFKN
jgi:ATP-dependent RNA helicase DeaD